MRESREENERASLRERGRERERQEREIRAGFDLRANQSAYTSSGKQSSLIENGLVNEFSAPIKFSQGLTNVHSMTKNEQGFEIIYIE